jgi:hypothetical protein
MKKRFASVATGASKKLKKLLKVNDGIQFR